MISPRPALLVLLLFLLAGPTPGASRGRGVFDFTGPVVDPDDGTGFGFCVAGGGDADDDGIPDYIVGAPRDAPGEELTGSVRVFSGSDGALLHLFRGAADDTEFGAVVAFAGDVNGDGCDDIAGTASSSNDRPGLVRIYSGATGTLLHELEGSGEEEWFGHAVAGLGDLDGDGRDDVLVSAPGAGDACEGLVRIYSGASGNLLRELRGTGEWGLFGSSAAGAGDLDDDGVPDFIVGAEGRDDDRGAVFVYSGSDGALLWSIAGATTGDAFGQCVGDAGDVNGDGFDDVVIGAPEATTTGETTGAAYVLSGVDGSLLFALTGPIPSGLFGAGVAGVGDFDADGRDDVAVGAPGEGAGLVRVYSGASGDLIDVLRGDTDGDSFGWSVSGAGDRDADGWTEILVGAPDFADLQGPRGAACVRGADRVPPTGQLAVQDGATWVDSPHVVLFLECSDQGSGVSAVRFREGGGAWTDWEPPEDCRPWILAPGDGEKVVQAQLRDLAGNDSDPIGDSIRVDRTKPRAGIAIDGGADCTARREVTLALTWEDDGIGVEKLRLAEGEEAWGAWLPLRGAAPWTLADEDGTHRVQVQVRDRLGHESVVRSGSILLDRQAPTCSFTLNGGARYIRSGEPILLTATAEDEPGGSGLRDFAVSFDEGASRTDWTAWTSGGSLPVAHPGAAGQVVPRLYVRDRAGNESSSAATPVYFLPGNLPRLEGGARVAANLVDGAEVFAWRVALCRGDTLSVRLKSREPRFAPVLDLVSPSGAVWTAPAGAKKPGIRKFPAEEIGEYVLLLRTDEHSPSATGDCALAVKVKQGRESKGSRGDRLEGDVAFPAADGTVFSAKLRGDDLAAGMVSLVGPNGPVSLAVSVSRGRASIAPVVLDQGTGTYRLVLAAGAPVGYRLKLKR